MKYFLLLSLSVFTLFSCKKAKIKSVETNNSVDSLTYQPKVPGSTWSYQVYLSGTLNKTYTTTRLTYDSTINGKVYQVFDAGSEGYQYIRQDGDKYYNVLTTSTNKTELMVIDASKNVNETWVGGVNGSDTYYYTMIEKYPAYYLDGFTFKNVLKIYQERKDASNNVTLSGNSFYAQGVGQIYSDGSIVYSGVSISTFVKLVSVDLK